jgi:hypothetical protein
MNHEGKQIEYPLQVFKESGVQIKESEKKSGERK